MKKNILFVSMYIGITGLFLYKTIESNSNTHDFPIDIIGYNPSESIVKTVEKDSIEQQAVSQEKVEHTESSVEVEVAIEAERSITDILPNANELSNNELIDEAEILLASRDSQKNSDGLFILNSLAADKNARANYILAQLYDKGFRVQKDDERAFKFYKVAALSGSDDANIFMFNHYLDNKLTTQEHYDEAFTWFKEAIQNDRNAIAHYGLAYIYEIGLGVKADQAQAIEHYKKSAQNNFVLSYERLGDLYLLTNDAKNIEEALLLFQRAANADIPTAQFKLGYMYEEGLGTRQDYETARFWYQKAVNHDLGIAQVALADLYAGALGVERDNVKAYKYYRSAAEKHNIVAQIAVARSFERGLGVDKNLDRAMFWYSKAAEQNDATAQYNLGRILEEYEEIRNLNEAKKWYGKASEAGIAEAKSGIRAFIKVITNDPEEFYLTKLNTFGVEATARNYLLLNSLGQLKDLGDLPQPLFYLGKGSNVLFTKDYHGTILHNCLTGIECLEEEDDTILLKAYAGEDWHQLVTYTLENNWFGLECLAYIPSSVGATPVQNIGAYGVEVGDLIERVHVYNIKMGQYETYSKEECRFGYRDSIFKSVLKDRLIISVEYRLYKNPIRYSKLYPAVSEYLSAQNIEEYTPQDIFSAVVAIRQSKLPEVTEIGSAGSFFKNPIVTKGQVENLRAKLFTLMSYPYDECYLKLSAGQIIDMLGFKGQYINNVGMYEKQALILVNLGGATGKQLYEYSQKVMREVQGQLGICLEPEVIIL